FLELVLGGIQPAAERRAFRRGQAGEALLGILQGARPAQVAGLGLLQLVGVIDTREQRERLFDDGVQIHVKIGDRGRATRTCFRGSGPATGTGLILRARGAGDSPVSRPWSPVSGGYTAKPALAFSTNRENAGLSSTAMSARTLRSTSTAARFSPFMNR